MGEKINIFWEWCLENHPGKLIGTLSGFVLSLLIIVLGFWQTLLLFMLTATGYYLGKCWDDGELPPWYKKFLHRISFWSKN